MEYSKYTKSQSTDKNDNERGIVLILAAILIPVLLGFAGLAIDIGWLYFNKIGMQNAADAGALAGAFQLKRGQNNASIQAMARHDTSVNGYTQGLNGTTVTVNNPPTSGNFSGNSNYVEVIINQQVDTFFIKFVYTPAMSVSGRAVAGFTSSTNSTCVITLNPTSTPRSLWITSGTNVQLPDCAAYVDSTHNDAMTVIGSSSIFNAKSINIVGGLNNGGTVTPTPITGSPPLSDPLATYSPPAPGPCTYTEKQIYKVNTTINPGVYCGGIDIQQSPTITFNPGIYYLIGFGLSASVNATLIGTGVTFVNSFATGYNYGPINIGNSGPASITLSAPTTGATKGLLFYNDRLAPSRISTIGGSTGGNVLVKLSGVLYFPTGQLNYRGGSINVSDAGTYMYLIAYDINFSGNNRINFSESAPWPNSSGGSGAVSLAE